MQTQMSKLAKKVYANLFSNTHMTAASLEHRAHTAETLEDLRILAEKMEAAAKELKISLSGTPAISQGVLEKFVLREAVDKLLTSDSKSNDYW